MASSVEIGRIKKFLGLDKSDEGGGAKIVYAVRVHDWGQYLAKKKDPTMPANAAGSTFDPNDWCSLEEAKEAFLSGRFIVAYDNGSTWDYTTFVVGHPDEGRYAYYKGILDDEPGVVAMVYDAGSPA